MNTWQLNKTYRIVNPGAFLTQSSNLRIINQRIFEKISRWAFTVIKIETGRLTDKPRVTKVKVHTNRGPRTETLELSSSDFKYFDKASIPSWIELQHEAYESGNKPETGFKQFVKSEAKIIKKSAESHWPFSPEIKKALYNLPEDKLKAIVTEAANDPDMKAEADFFISINGTVKLSINSEVERIKAIEFLKGIKVNTDVELK